MNQSKSVFVCLFACVVVFLIFPSRVKAQTPEWVKITQGSGYAGVAEIEIDHDGNVIACGTFRDSIDLDPGPGVSMAYSFPNYSIFIVKADMNGDLIWAKTINQIIYNTPLALECDSIGNIYFSGAFGSKVDFDPGQDTFYLDSPSGRCFFLAKLDTDGDILWARQFEESLNSLGKALKLNNSGYPIVTGLFQDRIDFDPSQDTLYKTSNGDIDLFLAKFDPSGDLVWVKQVGGSYIVTSTHLEVDKNDNLIIAGKSEQLTGDSIDFDPGPSAYYMPEERNNFFLKLDSIGNFVWVEVIENATHLYINDMDLDQGGNIISTGNFSDSIDFNPGPGSFYLASMNTWSNDAFVLRLDPNGNFSWVKKFESSDVDSGNELAIDNNGNIFSSGTYRDTLDIDPGVNQFFLLPTCDEDTYLAKLDSSGNLIWGGSFHGNTNYSFTDIKLDNSENIFFGGSFSGSLDFNPENDSYFLTSSDTVSAFWGKLSSLVISVEENKFNNEVIVFPNPTSGIIQIENLGLHNFESYTVANSLGQIISSNIEINSETISIEIPGPSGLYFISFKVKNGNLVTSKVIKEQ